MKDISLLDVLFRWDARMGRRDFIFFGIVPAFVIIIGALFGIAAWRGIDVGGVLERWEFWVIAGLMGLYAIITSVKRLHDFNSPGWIVLVPLFIGTALDTFLVPHVMGADTEASITRAMNTAITLMCLITKSSPGENLYDAPSKVRLFVRSSGPLRN